MTLPLSAFRAHTNAAALDTLDYLSAEQSIPPMYTCLQIGGFFFSKVAAYYKQQGEEVPPELMNFLEKEYPKIVADSEKIVQLQYLTLHTQGTS